MNSQAPVDARAAAPVPPKKRRITRRRFLLSSIGLVTLAGGGTGGYSYWEAKSQLVVTPYRIVSPRWTAGKRLSITVIADLHAGGPNMGVERIRGIVDTANALRSDVVVLLGDYFATHRFVNPVVPHPVWAAELKRLRAPFGVWAILGNHDWWYDVEGVRKALAEVNIPLLENQVVPLGEEGNRFWLAGLGDQIAHRIGPNDFRGEDDLPSTLARVRTDDPIILLAHEPDIFPNVPDNVALTLAGHTHGGQIRIPLIWPWLVPSAYGARYAYGHIVEDHRQMIVSGGLGTSIVPLRLGVPPEIVHVEISGRSRPGGDPGAGTS
jgi:predicted MPP superfamily phosphohydrolase